MAEDSVRVVLAPSKTELVKYEDEAAHKRGEPFEKITRTYERMENGSYLVHLKITDMKTGEVKRSTSIESAREVESHGVV